MKIKQKSIPSIVHCGILHLMVLLFCSMSPAQNLDQRLAERFRSEAPLAWRASEDRYKHFFQNNTGWTVEINRSGFFPIRNGKKSSFDTTGITKRIGTDFGLVTFKDIATNDEVTHLYNPQYFASLKQNKTIEGWKVGEILKISERGISIAEVLLKEKPIVNLLIADIASSNEHPFGNCPIEPANEVKDIFELEDFQIDRIEEIKDAQGTTFKVEFRYKTSILMGTSNSPAFVKKTKICEAIFDPENNWCLMHFEGGIAIDGKVNVKTIFKYEYKTTERVQFCTKREKRQISVADKKEIELDQLQMEFNVENLLPADFTLTAFGIPEPDWYTPPRPWWLYSSLAGMGLLVAGALLLKYGKGVWNRN